MASYCACCGKSLGFGGVQGTVNHLGQKLKLCETCSNNLEEMEQAVVQGDYVGFERQYPRFEAKIIPKQTDESKWFQQWWQDYKGRTEVKFKWKKKEEEEKYFYETMLLTTGDFFEGHHVQKYLGVVTGETILGTGFLSEFKASFSDLLGEESNAFMDKMRQAREASMKRLKKNALDLEANAVLGIHFSVLTLGQNMMGVSATGTAVLLEPDAKT